MRSDRKCGRNGTGRSLRSALSLLVLGVLADHHDVAFSSDDLALFTNLFNRRFNLHDLDQTSLSYLVRQVMRPLLRS